uniref:Rab3 GTPase-activating protein catalytic subunit n=1 Tax=Albugo laibachii Nc14 TaxID=890382 RepID=F0WLZ0_9STRA|nr:Rab3 GTPaseactivating protein catalytic subunit puta [Albugo laibachii Nc14]|eukprot:CCA22317.1 Rab3 GTPaseactivating protein catalytic subunit puta [Albugo laibachii Nc14]
MENCSHLEEEFQSQFVDYTNATSFEYFISSIENVIEIWSLENKGHVPHNLSKLSPNSAINVPKSGEALLASSSSSLPPMNTLEPNTDVKYELLPIEMAEMAEKPSSIPSSADALTACSYYLMLLCGGDVFSKEDNSQVMNERSNRQWRIGMEHFTPTMLSIANSDRDSPNVLHHGHDTSFYNTNWSEYRVDDVQDEGTSLQEWNTEVTWHPQQLNQLLSRWFGVSEAILIFRVAYPCGTSDLGRDSNIILLQGSHRSRTEVDDVEREEPFLVKVEEMDGDEANYVLSSLTLALSHRNCTLPFFVPVNDLKEGNWLGGSIPGSFGTTSLTFETQRVQEVWFPQSCISGLLDYFKSKLQLPIDTTHDAAFKATKGCLEPGIRVSAWYKYQWFPSDLVGNDAMGFGESFPWRTSKLSARHFASRRHRREMLKLLFGKKNTSVDTSSWGCRRSPLKRMNLVVAWKNLREGTFVDNAVHSTLNPVDAPEWFLRAKLHSFRAINERKPEMPLSKLLSNLTMAYSNARELGKDVLLSELAPPLERSSSWISRSTDDATSTNKQEDIVCPASMPDSIEKASDMTLHSSRSYHDAIPAARAATVLGNAIGSLTSSIMAAATWKGTDIKIIQEVIDDLFSMSIASTENQDRTSPPSSSLSDQDDDDDDDTFDIRFATSSEPPHIVLEPQVIWVTHTAPPDTLTAALACRMGTLHGVTAMSLLWVEFVSRLRDCWTEKCLVPLLGTEYVWNGCLEGKKRSKFWLDEIFQHDKIKAMEAAFAPDFRCCLLHQKLQLLNCCLLRHAVNSRDSHLPNENSGSGVSVVEEGIKSDDEYFDSMEQTHDELRGSPMNEKPRGVLKASKHYQKLLLTGATMNEPILQVALPVTEDIVRHHEEIITSLDESSDSVRLRQEMQSATLMSDMQAFKAANSGAVLADFIRWYTPKDWISFHCESLTNLDTDASIGMLAAEESSLPLTGKDKWWFPGEGMLSQRTRPIDDHDSNVNQNFWQEMWEKCSPKSVAEQKALFTPDHEAEKVFHYLETIRPVEMFHQMLVAAMGGCVYTLLTVFDASTAFDSHQNVKSRQNMDSSKGNSIDRKVDALPPFIGTHMSKLVEACDRAVSLLDEALAESHQLNQPIRQAGSLLQAAMEMALDACWNVVKVMEDVEILSSEALSLLNYLAPRSDSKRKSGHSEFIEYWSIVDSMLQSSHECVFLHSSKKNTMTAVHSHSTIRPRIAASFHFPMASINHASFNLSDTSNSVPQPIEPIQREYVLRSICCRSFLQQNNVKVHSVNRWQAQKDLEGLEESDSFSKLEATAAELLARSGKTPFGVHRMYARFTKQTVRFALTLGESEF